MNGLIALDLSKIFFSLRKTGRHIEYGNVVELLKQFIKDKADEKEADWTFEVVGFTTFSEFNKNQQDFVERLREQGIDVKTYPPAHGGEFTAEILAYALARQPDEVVIVSNDPCLLPAADVVEDHAVSTAPYVSIAFFSDDVPPFWAPRILKGSVSFCDLADPGVKDKVLRLREAA